MAPQMVAHARTSSAVRLAAVAVLALALYLIEIRAIEFTYARIGVPSRHLFSLLLLTLLGSRVNLPLGRVAPPPALDLSHMAPEDVPLHPRWVGPTVIAVNVGGAVVPVLLSAWILVVTGTWGEAAIVGGVVAWACYRAARLVPGRGVGVPAFLAPLIAAAAALVVAPATAPAVAFVGGTLGTLIGADLLHLGGIRDLGVPIAAIGGAGTFDAIFVTGVLAALLA